MVTGEAGVGKSRLVAEFQRSVTESDACLYQGTCMTYARAKPFWLIANLLRDILHLSETDPGPVQCETLHAYLDQLGLDRERVFPYLANVLGLTQTDPEVEARLRHLDNAALQKLTHASVREVFLAEARTTPSVLVFEDLHWVDPASKDFLEHLIKSVEDVPLMLILVSRQAERETVLPPLILAAKQRRGRLVDIQLSPLTPSEGQVLAGRLIKQTTQHAETLKRRIVKRAEGNPFYAEEIVRMLIEQGGITGEDGVWRVTPQALELVEEVPGTLNGLVLARFDRLPETLRQTLQRAAVLGSSFPIKLLTDLNGAQSEIVAEQISELENRQFLIPSPQGLEEGYTFRHAIMQEVVYKTLLKRDRQKLHEQVARVIEQSTFWLPDERVEALAYHYVQSSNPSQAIPHLITSGTNATRRCAYETAIQHYRRALELMQGQSADHDDQFLQAQVGLGGVLKFVGEYIEAVQILEEALQHLLRRSLVVDSMSLLPILVHSLREMADIRVREGLSDEAVAHLQAGLDALGEGSAQAHPRLWRSLIDRLAWVRFRQGKLDEAFTLASSATLGLDAETGDDPLTLASLYNTLGGAFWQWGNLSEAAAYVKHSLEAYQSFGYGWGMAIAYTNLGVLHYVQGIWPEAAEYFEQAYLLRRENGYLPEQAVSLNNLGILRLAMGDHTQARQDLESSLAISQRLGDDFGIMYAQVGLGQLATAQSRFEEAATHLEVALDLCDVAGEHQAVQARWLWALVQSERGHLLAGLESAEQALKLAREAGLTEAEADCRRVLGALRTRAGEVLEAEALLQEAMDLYLQLDAPYGRGLTQLELGYLYQKMANTDDLTRGEWQAKALATFSTAVDQFEALGATYDLRRAQAALSQLQTEMVTVVTREEFQASRANDTPPHPRLRLPEGEWRTAAIVWLELSPPPDADEEAVFEATALAVPAITIIAQEHQGQVIRRRDGLTMVFGAPMAYEDDVERAVQTAWDIVRYLQEPAHQGEVPLVCRAAVSYGEVVAGQIGSHLHTQFSVEGEPVKAAQQVVASAPPGKVWVTETVQAATERLFTYQPLSAPVTADLAELSPSELTGVRERPDPARGLPGLSTKLIGRQKPLRSMAKLAENLSRGMGGLIWIEGEPGIGKSRLMREFGASMTSDGCPTWTGRCSPQRSGQAFSLLSDLLGQVINLQPTDTPDEIRARIHQAVQTWPRDARVTRPYLEILLGVQPSGLEGKRLEILEPEQLRQQIFVALRRLFKSLASEQPAVILLDDLHCIDPMSAELLQFLLTIVTSAPILFVCAQRRQGADSPNDRLVRVQSLISTQTVSLSLGRLSTGESVTLLSELLPGLELPDRLREIILERSEGNPYFIEEYVRMLIEQGHVHHQQGSWTVAPGRNIEEIPLPGSLETLIRSRIDALPSELKQVVQHAAAIGASFEASLLESVVELSGVRSALSRLESRQLIQRGAENGRWGFSHSLIETVAYNIMLKAQRRTVHLKVAQALETRWAGAEAEHAEELAYHYSRASESAKALTYLLLAGERAADRFANEEAKSYFEQAAEQLRAGLQATDDTHWRVSTGLGDAYRAMGQYVEATDALKEGLDLTESEGLSDYQRAGLHRRLGETAQKHGKLEAAYEYFAESLTILGEQTDSKAQTEVARVLNGLAWIHFVQGHFDQAREASEASLTYAQSVDALNELASAENLLGGIYYHQSEWKSALHHTTRAMILREQMGYTWGVASTLSNLGILAVSAGHWSKARSFFERSLALRQEMGDVEGMAIVHNNLATLARDQGDLTTAEFHFRESLAVATPFKIAFHDANATNGLAQVFLLRGDIDAAQETITASLERAQAIRAEDLLAEIFRIEAEIWLARSDWDKAKAAADRSADIAAETGNRSLDAAAWRVLSEIQLQRNNPRAAREALANAQKAIADVGDDLEAGRVAAQAGRIHLYGGQLTPAEEELRVAQEIFMRLGASLDLKRVEKALKRQSVPSANIRAP